MLFFCYGDDYVCAAVSVLYLLLLVWKGVGYGPKLEDSKELDLKSHLFPRCELCRNPVVKLASW